ncbi:MAG: hypothetical protein ABWW70_07455 [Thermoproteota archaeon]
MSTNGLHGIVILTGTSGLDIGRTLEVIEQELGVATAKFEEYVEREFKAPIYHVAELLLVDYRRASAKFREAFRKMLESLKGSRLAVVGAHSVYYRRSSIVANPLLGYLREYGERVVIIDYVDDYYHALFRLAARVAEGHTPEIASFQVIDPAGFLYWRSAQESVSSLATSYGAFHFIFASKHSREAHIRLISMALDMAAGRPKQYRTVYVSHPITRVRAKARSLGVPLRNLEEVNEIETVKRDLERSCEDLIVLSPTTIDELIVDENDNLETVIRAEERWPHPSNGIHDYPYPIDLSDKIFDTYLYPVEDTVKNKAYLRFLRRLIEASVERRDLGYVSQADFVFAYRPTMYGEVHMGVETEIKTAIAMSKPVYSIIPREERNIEYRLFRFEYPLSSLEELLHVLRCRA